MFKKKLLLIVFTLFYCVFLQAKTDKVVDRPLVMQKDRQTQPIPVQHDAEATKELADLLKNINVLTADFTQSNIDVKGRIKTEKGVLQLKKPDRFRWLITDPFDQEIIANGDRIWIIDPDFKQVVIKKQDDSTGPNPVQLLSGNALVFLKDFRVVLVNDKAKNDKGGKSDKRVVYTLKPIRDNDLFELLEVHFIGNQLATICLNDSLGGKRKIYLSKVQINKKLNDVVFVPDIKRLKKEGYDVIDESGL